MVTNGAGYKAIDYSKLPLLTIQAVKELKEQNDKLKDRVSEVERLIEEMRGLAAAMMRGPLRSLVLWARAGAPATRGQERTMAFVRTRARRRRDLEFPGPSHSAGSDR